MTQSVQERLTNKGIVLPTAAAPVANYVPFVITGNTLIVSGQLPMQEGSVTVTGKLGADVTIEDGMHAARLCAINIAAQAYAALQGDLDRVTRCVRLGGFVASTADFFDHPKVINGASDCMVDIFGDTGKHARAAVGVPVLPLNAVVEVDAIFEIKT